MSSDTAAADDDDDDDADGCASMLVSGLQPIMLCACCGGCISSTSSRSSDWIRRRPDKSRTAASMRCSLAADNHRHNLITAITGKSMTGSSASIPPLRQQATFPPSRTNPSTTSSLPSPSNLYPSPNNNPARESGECLLQVTPAANAFWALKTDFIAHFISLCAMQMAKYC